MSDPVPYLTVPEVYDLLISWLKSRESFYHVRYGDGEVNAMFNLADAGAVNSDGHSYHYTDMGPALIDTFVEMYTARQRGNKIIGSFALVDREHPAAIKLWNWVNEIGGMYRIPVKDIKWASSDFWFWPWLSYCNGELERLFKTIRRYSESNLVVLVSSDAVSQAKHCIGAKHVFVPGTNSWLARHAIYHSCLTNYHNAGDDPALFIWCAGFAGKVLSWEIHRDYPDTCHIDMGHLFDGIFGNNSRDWLTDKPLDYCRPDILEKTRQYYRNVLKPYVFSFIPSGSV